MRCGNPVNLSLSLLGLQLSPESVFLHDHLLVATVTVGHHSPEATSNTLLHAIVYELCNCIFITYRKASQVLAEQGVTQTLELIMEAVQARFILAGDEPDVMVPEQPFSMQVCAVLT